MIKGCAINNDGSGKVGYTAPSVNGQAEAIAEAMMLAGVKPETVSYIEAHGTGTALGDPIEITALSNVFRASTREKRFLRDRFSQNKYRSFRCSSRGCRAD